MFKRRKPALPTPDQALPGRAQSMPVAGDNVVTGHPMVGPFPEHLEVVMVGMGCFWGAERVLWKLEGVWTTAVGYAAGHTPNATYEEVCSGMTGHNEVVLVVFDPSVLPFDDLLRVFWESHDPTQGMRQGMDQGTQYRSGVYVYSEAHRAAADASRDTYQGRLTAARLGSITTEILDAPTLYYAEDYHQQYLHKNPTGYCGIGGTGVGCPIGSGA